MPLLAIKSDFIANSGIPDFIASGIPDLIADNGIAAYQIQSLIMTAYQISSPTMAYPTRFNR
ncbi:hypothetical protein F5X96DRAFT_666852 [Biscogniauxia mediterranea]|nr:hypothetical protein F5X96DRAFT_666852 [Biscogniauxia mediterranea]